MNKQYGKFLVDGSSVTCCPRNQYEYIVLRFAQECPDGFLEIVKDPDKPSVHEGQELWFTYERDGDIIRKHYFLKRAPKVYSKLKLYVALSAAGLWGRFEEWMKLQSVEADGVTLNALTAFNIAQDISSDHPLFDAFLAKAIRDLGVDASVAESILVKAETAE